MSNSSDFDKVTSVKAGQKEADENQNQNAIGDQNELETKGSINTDEDEDMKTTTFTSSSEANERLPKRNIKKNKGKNTSIGKIIKVENDSDKIITQELYIEIKSQRDLENNQEDFVAQTTLNGRNSAIAEFKVLTRDISRVFRQRSSKVGFLPHIASDVSQISLASFGISTTPDSASGSYSNEKEIFYTKLILCVGVCTLDIIHQCEEFPKENGRLLVEGGIWQRSGNASNNCTVLRHFGAKCEFLGVMSSLPIFKFLQDDCRERNIIIENCPLVESYPPFSSLLSCKPTGTYTVVHTNLGFPILKFEHFKEKIQLQHYTWIHFEGRNVEETKPMINMIRVYNHYSKSQFEDPIMISLEMAKTDRHLLALAMRANLVFVGREFAMSLGWSTPKDTVYNLRQLISSLQLMEEKDMDEIEICFRSPHIVCPWGQQGCSILTSAYDYDHIPAEEIDNVIDSKASGDTFVAATIHAINNLGMDIKKAVKMGYDVALYKMQYMGLDCIRNYTVEF